MSNSAPTFAIGDGKVTTAIGSGTNNDVGQSVVVQADGKIVVAGYSGTSNSDFAVVRYNTDGSLDTAFGTGGKVTTDFSFDPDFGQSIMLQSDGKIVVAGSANGANDDFALVRYNSDGSLDTAFGSGGKVTTAIGSGDDGGGSAVLQSDGKIVVAGYASNGTDTDFALVRYNSDGSLDTSFDTDGKVTTAIQLDNDAAMSVAVQSDGKIVVAGYASVNIANNDFIWTVVRYNSNGSLDTSFDTDGKVTTDIWFSSIATSVVLQPDGKIVVAGYSDSGTTGQVNNFTLTRYNSNGSLDTSFNGGGVVVTGHGQFSFIQSVMLQPDGKIVVAGDNWNGSNSDFALVRYNSDGSVDTSFGANGGVSTAIGPGQDIGYSVVLQADGKIVVAGTSRAQQFSDQNFALVRYNADGSLDLSFDGVNTLNATPTFVEGHAAVVLDSDAAIYDAQLEGANSYAGATLSLARSGGADAHDVFGGSGTLSLAGGSVVVASVTVGTFTQSGGTLTITFNANATNARTDEVLRQLTYSNSDDAPPASVQIAWTFSDGNSGAQGTGGALSANGSITVAITAVNDAPVITVQGDLDAVVANQNSDNVNALLGDGAGGLTSAGTAGAGDGARSVALGDVDGDGDLDALVGNEGSSTVSVLLGNGLGGFTAAAPVGVGNFPISIALGDVNGDGNLDALVANINSDDVSVLLGDGAGGFTAAAPIGAGDGPTSVALGDMDGDGDLDALVANQNSNNVSVLLGDGAGGFTAAAPVGVGFNPQSVALGDVDGDGDLDALVANLSSDAVSVLLGDGAGGFAAAAPVGVGVNPQSVALGDVDGDGDLDALVANRAGHTVSVLLGNGAGGFAVMSSVPASNPNAVALGDLDGDGDLDALVGQNSVVTVLRGDGAGGFTASAPVSASGAHRSVALGNLDNAQVTDEDTAIVFNAANGNAITLSDVDAGGNDETLTLAVAHGRLTLATVLGLTSVAGDGTASVTLTGSVTEINAALDGLSYRPDLDYNGKDKITITANDNGYSGGPAQTATMLVPLIVNAVADPVVVAPSGLSTNEDHTLVVNGFSVSDADSANLTVVLTAQAGSTLTLSQATGLSFTSGDGVGDQTMAFSGSVADINNALAGMRYRPAEDFNGAASFSYSVDDGSDLVPTAGSVNITVNAVNDAPRLLNASGFTGQQYVLDQSFSQMPPDPLLAFLQDYAANNAADFTVQNPAISYGDTGFYPFPTGIGDTNNFFMRFTGLIEVFTAGSYVFRVNSDDGFFLFIDGELVSEFPGPRGAADTDTAFMVLSPGGHSVELYYFEFAGGDNVIFSYSLDDGAFQTVGTTGDINTVTLSLDAALTINEDSAAASLFSASVLDPSMVMDIDSVSLTATLTLANPAAGTLSGGGFIETGTPGKYSLTGAASAVKAALIAVKFNSANNFHGTTSVSLLITDGQDGPQGTNPTGTVSITVNAANDAPVGQDSSVTATEDTTYVFTAADFPFTDSNDSPANAFEGAVITTLPASGTLVLFGVGNVTAGDFVTATDIAAGNLRYTPPAQANGTAFTSFTFQVRDNGGTANGGHDADQSAKTMTIDVNAVNDAVTLANAIADQTSIEDGAWSFTFAANTFADLDGTTPDYTATLANGDPLPAWLTFDGVTRSFSGTPLNVHGTFDIRITASDGSTSATDTFRLTVTPTNSVPVLGGLDAPGAFAENTVNDTAQLLDTDVTFTDLDEELDGGALTVSGLLAEDTIAIRNQGTAGGEIGVSGSNVTYGGTTIGTFTGGNAGATLTVTFSADATAAAVEALIENLTYANSSDAPSASRTLEIKITDDAGAAAIATVEFARRGGAANPFTGLNAGNYSTPSFADLDGDGDIDAVVGEGNGTLQYFRNTGTATAPVFVQQTGAANPFSGVDVGTFSAPSLADLDGDGDLDAMVGGDNVLHYFQKTGSATAPAFNEEIGAANPFNSFDVGYESKPSFADLDGDGDLDAVVGEYSFLRLYFQNTGSATAPVFVQQTGAANPLNGIDSQAQNTPSFVDLDGDGDLDAVVGDSIGLLHYFRNTGSATAPVFVQQIGAANPFGGVTVNLSSAPSFADLNGDGDIDAVVGALQFNLIFFENTKPRGIAPDFVAQTGADNPVDGVSIGGWSTPVFADSDGDGDDDLVVGNLFGDFSYFRNTGTATAPVFVEQTGAANPFDGINGDTRGKLSLADLDGDGDLDAVVGALTNRLNFYLNTGSATEAVYVQQTGAANPFDGVAVDIAAPSFVDLDSDGDLDALVGESNGILHYFRNTGTATSPAFTLQTGAANPFNGVDVGLFSTPAFADLDRDGDLDAVVGDYNSGVLKYFLNTGTATAPVFVQQTGSANPFTGLDVGFETAPAFTDLDGDGDLDLVTGVYEGNLNYFRNTGSGFELTVNVTAENDTPVLANAIADQSSAEDVAWSFTFDANAFSDPDGTTPIYTATLDNGDPLPGSLTFTPGTRSFSGTAPLNFNGVLDIKVTASDGTLTVSDTFRLTVTAVNDVPVPAHDALSSVAEESGQRTIAFASLTGNDSSGPADESGQTLTITAVSNAVGGTVSISGTNVLFTPTANFNGAASFFYTVRDNGTTNGSADFRSTIGTAAFTVTEVNDAPVAADDALSSVAEDSGQRTISFASLTGNDSSGPANESGQARTITAVSNAIGGIVSISGTNVLFTPTANFNGTASFDYTVQDNGTTNGSADFKTDIGAVSFTVTEANDAPVAQNGSASGNEDTAINGTLSAADVDSASITYSRVTQAAHGTVTVNANGTFSYTPDPNFNGSDSFTFKANDGSLDSNTATVNLTVNPVNDTPLIVSDGGGDTATASVPENTTGITTVHATDIDSPSITYSISGGSDAGKFQINASTGALSFIASPDFEGPSDADHNNSYIVHVRASDGSLADDQEITVAVTDVNEAPLTVHWVASVDVGSHPAGWLPSGIGDFNADGTDDLAWYNSSTNGIDIWKLSNGQWAGSADTGTHPAGYQPVGFGDYIHDGTNDVLWFNSTTRDVDLWKVSNGQWAGSTNIGTHPAGSAPISAGDFNGDDSSDIAWHNPTTNAIDIWTIVNGQWAGSTDVGSHPAGYAPALTGDFNGDGTSDIAWYNAATGDLDIWKISNGQWAGSSSVGSHPAGWQPLGAGDFNKDGTSDIAWYNPTTNNIDIWLISNGQWAGSVDLGAHPAGSTAVGVGDFDHNGVSDIMWRNTSDGQIESWLLAYS